MKKLKFLFFCLVLLTIFLEPTFAANEKMLIKLTGFSMYPVINNNDIFACESADSYKIGDVITFRRGEQNIAHRIIGEINGKFITKGDNNILPDFFLVNKNDVICKVIFKK